MQRGRKPKPTALKLVTGNPGNRRLNESEPKPAGEVKRPAFVKGKAAKLWAQYAPDLEAKGVLTAWDVDMFGTWCCLMAEFQADSLRFTSAKLSQMRALASCFGLEPSARSRLKLSGKEEGKDPSEKFFA